MSGFQFLPEQKKMWATHRACSLNRGESFQETPSHPFLPLFLKAPPVPVLATRLRWQPGSWQSVLGSSSICRTRAISCELEQEMSPKLTSPSGGNVPEHLEDLNIWKTSLSSDKCAGHSIQLGPQETSHASAGSRGVGCSGGFLLIGSKCCQRFVLLVCCFFFLGKSSSALMAFGSKSDRGKPAAHLHLQ